MLHYFAGVLSHYGYLGVAAFMVAEGCGIPVPSEALLVTAAAFAARGKLSIWGVMLAGALGGIVGGMLGYLIGARGGLLFIRRFGGRVGVDEAKLARAQDFFRRRGGSAVFLARFIAFVRLVVPMLAGVAHMSFTRFGAYNAAGAFMAALDTDFWAISSVETFRCSSAISHSRPSC
jgi:membrane protein DedA with SNARE-associated domain